MTAVLVCNGCGFPIDMRAWPRFAGAGEPSSITGGPVNIKPGVRVDWCPACTTVAFTAVNDFKPLIKAMRDAGLTGNQHCLGLQSYMSDPLTGDEVTELEALPDREQSGRLVRRYGQDGWLVARQAMLLMLADRQATPA